MKYFFAIISLFIGCNIFAQDWTLRSSIDYALENNIQIQRAKLSMQSQEESRKQAKASMFPTLNFSASESFSNRQEAYSFGENYGISSNVTLFNGLRLINNLKQQDLFLQTSELAIQEAENNIEIAITQSYLQILYAQESVKAAELTLSYSDAQLKQGEIFFRVGSIAESDLAQLQARSSNDKYRLIVAQNNLQSQILSFKQLLELEIDDEISIYFPELSDDDIINIPPAKKDVYETALSFMPQVESSLLNIKTAEYALKTSRSGRYPTLSMSAGISTGHAGRDYDAYLDQLADNFAQNIGISLSFSILNRRTVKTDIAKSKILLEDSKLNAAQTEKDLLRSVESVYLDVISSQNRFLAAKEALSAAKISYELTEKRFNLGMKNTVELLNEKNAFENAQQEFLQAKYATILSQKLLDFYQNKEISL
jgi:outer membrane protein